MPSQTSFNVVINFPPGVGNIVVTPVNGECLETLFMVKLSGFDDEDLPLSYKYVFYTSAEDYETERVSIMHYFILYYHVDLRRKSNLLTSQHDD